MTLLGEVMATSIVTGGGTTPFPPLAQPLASARLINATANKQFFIFIFVMIMINLEEIYLESPPEDIPGNSFSNLGGVIEV